MPAASTGSERSRSTAVIITDHTNRGVWHCDIAGGGVYINNCCNKINSS